MYCSKLQAFLKGFYHGRNRFKVIKDYLNEKKSKSLLVRKIESEAAHEKNEIQDSLCLAVT